MVDLDHFIPGMDFLALVCWRLNVRKRGFKKERERSKLDNMKDQCGIVGLWL